jgi:hypothetical protein
MESTTRIVSWLFDSRDAPRGHLIARWLFLRALAAIYFSAFLALVFQIEGLNGPQGVLPAGQTLAAMAQALGPGALRHLWSAPTLFWISSSAGFLSAVVWIGLVASVLAFFNLWPRGSFFLCWLCFLSFVAAAADFSGYQSDGMLLEAGLVALFFAPPGLRPGWGAAHPPSRASLWLLQWEWFRIYFESGMVKILSGDPQWRSLTAMIGYYQNGPLPTWIGWYVSHLPRWFHVGTALGTLILEFFVVMLLFFGRTPRRICFAIVTPWQVGVIATANYAFLNYLVLALGVLLLDDGLMVRPVPARWRPQTADARPEDTGSERDVPLSLFAAEPAALPRMVEPAQAEAPWPHPVRLAGVALAAGVLTWVGYATTIEMVGMVLPLPSIAIAPARALDSFRVANQYGLFASMTNNRYEIEFQGSNDGQTWQAYTFRYKPQALNERPGLYAPYQPRFDWNLWFASLGAWQQNDLVPLTQERLLEGSPAVLSLFRGNPFPGAPPKYVRTVLWQYWFTSMEHKRQTGNWWRRTLVGQYSPTIAKTEDDHFRAVDDPAPLATHD